MIVSAWPSNGRSTTGKYHVIKAHAVVIASTNSQLMLENDHATTKERFRLAHWRESKPCMMMLGGFLRGHACLIASAA
jgi:hypothetical protein